MQYDINKILNKIETENLGDVITIKMKFQYNYLNQNTLK